jgi:hypothetical protein
MLSQASIILNILTILLVLFAVVIMYKVSKSPNMRESSKTTAHAVFEDSLKDPSNVIRNFYAEKKTGDIGSFTGSMSKFTRVPSVL